MSDNVTSKNWFSQGGADYARYRPEYPPELARYLASLIRQAEKALDVGCGTGQLTRLLADNFSVVVGVDPSESQLTSAEAHPAIRYQASPAEALPADFSGFNLITVAQAAHWFNLPEFYREVRRISAPDAVLALISYGVMQLDGELQSRFQRFYVEEIGPYWPAERKMVDDGYQTLAFPFAEITPCAMNITVEWPLEALLGYISTWSAVKKAEAAGKGEILNAFAADIRQLWGRAEQPRTIVWPINMRIGNV